MWGKLQAVFGFAVVSALIACGSCDLFTIFAMLLMLHAVSTVVSALIACGMCAWFTIFTNLGMLHYSATACDLCGLADVS